MRNIVLLGCVLLGLSCHKEQLSPNTCLVKDPLNELGWIKDSITRYPLGDITVSQAAYQSQTVFSIESYIGPDAALGTLYHCDGSVICKSYITIAGLSGNCKGIADQLTSNTIIYKIDR